MREIHSRSHSTLLLSSYRSVLTFFLSSPKTLPTSYGAHIAGLSANTVYTVTVHDPSGLEGVMTTTTWSTASPDAVVYYLDVRRRKFPLPFPIIIVEYSIVEKGTVQHSIA